MFLRASDNDRSRITNFLSMALEKGFITTEELHHRLEVAIAAKTFNDLLSVVEDIPGGKSLVKEAASAHIVSTNSYPFPHTLPTQSQSTLYQVRQGRRLPLAAIPFIFAGMITVASFAGLVIIPLLLNLIFASFTPIFLIGIFIIVRQFRRSGRHHHGNHRTKIRGSR